MTEFSTTASLYVQLDESSIRDERKKLEKELTADPIEVEVKPVEPSGSTMGSLRRDTGRRRSGRGGGGAGGALVESLENQSMALDDITDSWEENIELNERRNELLEELEEEMEKGNRSRMMRGGLGLGMGGGLAITIGLLGASKLIGALQNFSWPELPEFPDLPNLPDEIPVDVPDSLPVDAPDSIPVDAPDSIPLDFPENIPLDYPEDIPLDFPENIPLDHPEDIPLDAPDSIPLDHPDSIPLGKPDWLPLDVPKPDWIPIPIGAPDGGGEGSPGGGSVVPDWVPGPDDVVSGGETAVDTIVGAGEGAADWAGENSEAIIAGGSLAAGAGLALADGPLPFGDAAGASVAAAGGGGALLGGLLGSGATGHDSVGDFTQSVFGDNWGSSATGGRRGPNGQGVGPIEGFFARLYEPLAPNNMGRGGTAAATATMGGGRDARERYWERRDRDRQNRGSRQRPQINFSPTYEIDTRELKQQVQSDVREVESRISDIENELRGISDAFRR